MLDDENVWSDEIMLCSDVICCADEKMVWFAPMYGKCCPLNIDR